MITVGHGCSRRGCRSHQNIDTMEKKIERYMSEEIRRHQEEERQLRRLPIWSWYMKGARDMLLKLRDSYLTEEPHPRTEGKVTKEDRIINKACIDLILSSKDNAYRFLTEEYEIHLTDHERDKKGKLVKCRAYFARKVIRYEEI